MEVGGCIMEGRIWWMKHDTENKMCRKKYGNRLWTRMENAGSTWSMRWDMGGQTKKNKAWSMG